MSWARIMAPLSGGGDDKAVLAAATALAEPFGAELAGVYTPADVADLMPWFGEGFMGGVQATALESLQEAAAIGEAQARKAFDGATYANKRFQSLQTPVWAQLSAEVFNLFNWVNWSGYSGTMNDRNGNPLASFGLPSGALAPRQAQIGIRYDF